MLRNKLRILNRFLELNRVCYNLVGFINDNDYMDILLYNANQELKYIYDKK